MLMRQTRSDQIGFYLLLAVLAALSFWLIRSYLDIIAFSLMTVVLVKPLYDRIVGWVHGRAGLAVALTVVVIALVIIIPLWLAINLIAGQLGELVATVQQPNQLTAMTADINAALARRFGPNAQLPPAMQQKLGEITISLGTWLAGHVVNLGMAIPLLISRLFIFIGILGALLPNYHGFVRWIKQLSPLDDRIDDIFLRKIKLTIWAMFLAIFVIAVVQGLLMGVFIWIAGVPFTPLWTLIAVVAAMLPLGASLVALPLGGVELLIGNYTAGIIVLAGYLLVVSNIDSFVRPRLVPAEANLNFVMVLLSALGGYELFGFFGVVYGPVLMSMLLTALDVYRQYYAGAAPATPGQPSLAEPAAFTPAPPAEPALAAPISVAPSPPESWLLDELTHQPQAAPPKQPLPAPATTD